MQFSGYEIDIARQMKEAGLEWQPQVGHYVFDSHGMIEKPSPFQEHVYFILNLGQFIRIFGSTEEIAANCVWLPTWEQCRQILESQGVTGEALMELLRRERAIERTKERPAVYEKILENCKARIAH